MINRSMCVAMMVLLMPVSALAGTTCTQRSQDLLAALQAGHFEAATVHFDSQVKAAVPASTLEQVWTTALPAQFGAYDPSAKGQEAKVEAPNAIVTSLHFAQGWLDMRVTCNAKLEITGFRVVPGEAPAGAAAKPARKTISGAWGISKPTHVSSPLGPLPATLTLPHGAGPFAAVVLVGGSGAHDRDETIGPNKPFRDIARGLAKHGVASLRYDKRTFVYGAKIAGSTDFTVDDEVTDDALSAVRQLGKTGTIDAQRVFVLGHSLGAMLAPRIGKHDSKLAGLILMAAPARALLDVSAQQVREQARHGVSQAEIDQSEQAINAERKLLADADPTQPPTSSFTGVPQSYWMSLHDYNQVAVAQSLSMPMLILQGEADFQVSPKNDFARWEKALKGHKRVSFHLYPGLSHLFRPAGKTQTVADYMQPGPVDAKVIKDIAEWIKAQPHG